MASEPVRVERQTDGRHAVIGSDGQILGLHKSIWSAARQMHSYYGPSGSDAGAEAADAEKPSKAGTAGDHPSLPHPPVPRAARDTAKIPSPKIPKP